MASRAAGGLSGANASRGYSDWKPNQPQGLPSLSCLALDLRAADPGTGSWFAAGCAEPKRFGVIEYEPDYTPEPRPTVEEHAGEQIRGRYLRIGSDRTINLVEVEAFGPGGEPLVPAGIQMSSTYDSDRPSENCIDGVKESGRDNICHSGSDDPDPWLRVDYGTKVTIAKIIVTNRLDCCEDRIVGAIISVTNEPDREVQRSELAVVDGAPAASDDPALDTAGFTTTPEGYLVGSGAGAALKWTADIGTDDFTLESVFQFAPEQELDTDAALILFTSSNQYIIGVGGTASTASCRSDNDRHAWFDGCCSGNCSTSADACWTCDRACFAPDSCRHVGTEWTGEGDRRLYRKAVNGTDEWPAAPGVRDSGFGVGEFSRRWLDWALSTGCLIETVFPTTCLYACAPLRAPPCVYVTKRCPPRSRSLPGSEYMYTSAHCG